MTDQESLLGYVSGASEDRALPRVCCLIVDVDGRPKEFVYGDGVDPGALTRALWGRSLTSELQVKAALAAIKGLKTEASCLLFNDIKFGSAVAKEVEAPCFALGVTSDALGGLDSEPLELRPGVYAVALGKRGDGEVERLKGGADPTGFDMMEPFERLRAAADALPKDDD